MVDNLLMRLILLKHLELQLHLLTLMLLEKEYVNIKEEVLKLKVINFKLDALNLLQQSIKVQLQLLWMPQTGVNIRVEFFTIVKIKLIMQRYWLEMF
jgi:hypothetical protein